MKKPEVVYVRSGYNPLRALQKPVEARGVLPSRGLAMIEEIGDTSKQFARCLVLARANIAKHKAERLAPPKVAVSKEPQKDATKEALRKKIDKLLRQNEKLRREIAQG